MLKWLKEHSQWAKNFLLGAALIAVYKTFDNLSSLRTGISYIFDALMPFVIAFVIAYMLNIPIKKLNGLLTEKSKRGFIKKHSNAISIATVYIIFLIVFMLLISSIIPAIAKDLIDIYKNIPNYAESVSKFINESELIKKIGINPEVLNLSSKFSAFVEKFITTDILDYTKSITAGVMSFTSSLFDIFIGIIASVYMLIDKDRIIRGLKRIIKIFNNDGKADAFLKHSANANGIFTQYIYSRLISCAIMAVLCSIVLAIMGEKYALLLGIFIGFMDIIPYFGSIISWVVGFVVMAISGGFAHGFWCSIVMLVLQQIDGNIIAPRIMSDRLEIRPLAVIVAVSLGGSLFGFPGMIISVPVVAVLRAIAGEFIEEKIEETQGAENKEQI